MNEISMDEMCEHTDDDEVNFHTEGRHEKEMKKFERD
jgi:hypothetical protein